MKYDATCPSCGETYAHEDDAPAPQGECPACRAAVEDMRWYEPIDLNGNLSLRRLDGHAEHESARDWYNGYGWHLTTESDEDIELGVVDYDEVTNDDAETLANKIRGHADLPISSDEVETIAEKAREVALVAQAVEEFLEDAVTAHARGDLAGCIAALKSASALESEHGDDPATRALAAQLLTENEKVDDDEPPTRTPIEENPSYRASMRDAGRGHLLP